MTQINTDFGDRNEVSEMIAHRAALAVTNVAVDKDEAKELLEMLGLVDPDVPYNVQREQARKAKTLANRRRVAAVNRKKLNTYGAGSLPYEPHEIGE